MFSVYFLYTLILTAIGLDPYFYDLIIGYSKYLDCSEELLPGDDFR